MNTDNKKTMQRFLYVFLLFLTLSCIKEDEKTTKSGTYVNVRCNLNVASLEMVRTKANEIIEENSIGNLWVLQFNGQSDTSVLVKADYMSSPNISNLNLNLLTGANQSVYFIANSSDNSLFNSSNAPLNSFKISELKAKTIEYTSERDNYPSMGHLRMSGVFLGDIFTSGNSFSVNLKRTAAKISFSYTSIESDNPGEEGAIIKIFSVSLKNVPGNSKILSDPNNTKIEEPLSVIDYQEISAGLGATSGTVIYYMPENLRGVVPENTSPQYKAIRPPNKSSYLEVKGGYYPAGSSVASKVITYKIFLGKNSTNDYNINSNVNYKARVTFKGLNEMDSRISIDPSRPPSNCHIVEPSSSIIIPIGVKGNNTESTIEEGINVHHTAVSVGILWETTPLLISLKNFNFECQTVTVTASSNTGNALIFATDGPYCTGNILWSWHIWVTDYNPEDDANNHAITSISGDPYIFMDRNLGALSTVYDGVDEQNTLYYQFGRKDPFPGGVFPYSATTDSTAKPMIYSIQSPDQLIIVPEGNWCSTVSEQWWMGIGGTTNTPGIKTIYDPCPSGWRVPVFINGASPWSRLTSTNGNWGSAGWSWDNPYNAGFWPATGYRNGNITVFNAEDVGTNGLYWAASTDSNSNGFCLDFNNTGVNANGVKDRANAYSIRCIRE